MNDKINEAQEALNKEHMKLYKTLTEHYMALKRLLEYAMISIDTSMNILLTAAETEQKKDSEDG